ACPSLRRVVFLSQTEWMFQEDDKYVDVSCFGDRECGWVHFSGLRGMLLMTKCRILQPAFYSSESVPNLISSIMTIQYPMHNFLDREGQRHVLIHARAV
ncbi:hypothetical protein EDB19DRAFT_1638793, partial [Suillus lakei]